jgi:hypothetical protein
MRKFFTLLLLGVVAFVAYTYGAKAGKGRYNEIRNELDSIWNARGMKKVRKQAMKRAEKAAKSL